MRFCGYRIRRSIITIAGPCGFLVQGVEQVVFLAAPTNQFGLQATQRAGSAVVTQVIAYVIQQLFGQLFAKRLSPQHAGTDFGFPINLLVKTCRYIVAAFWMAEHADLDHSNAAASAGAPFRLSLATAPRMT